MFKSLNGDFLFRSFFFHGLFVNSRIKGGIFFPLFKKFMDGAKFNVKKQAYLFGVESGSSEINVVFSCI